MRLARITTTYPEYLAGFYAKFPSLSLDSYSVQRAALNHDAFAHAGAWPKALAKLGHECEEIVMNAEFLQRAWARENLPASKHACSLNEVALQQLKQFKPDAIWYTHFDAAFLCRIREEVPSVRFAFGWVGSAVPRTEAWRHFDLILSCAPEAVSHLRALGLAADHLQHGFDPQVNDRLVAPRRRGDVSFIGQIIKSRQFHLERQDLLDTLADHIDLNVYSPNNTQLMSPKVILRDALYLTSSALESLGVPHPLIVRLPAVGRAANWTVRPWNRLSRKVQRQLRPAIFGLDMYQAILDSHVVLNIHADSSPRFASNMRLFETTGVGGCLVTDWKSNLHELFEPDTEVVSYRSPAECVEKVKWLLDNPFKRDEIAKAGKARTLRDHPLERRAGELNDLLKRRTELN